MESLPLWGLTGLTVVVAGLSWAFRNKGKWAPRLVTILGLLAWLWLTSTPYAYGGLVFDRYTYFLALLITGVAVLTALILQDSPIFLLLSTVGTLLMIHADGLLLLFAGMTFATLPLVVWIGWRRSTLSSQEAFLKHFYLAGFALTLFFYGAALIYAATGETSLAAIQQVFSSGGAENRTIIFSLGVVFMVAGLAFKMAWVPFHFGAADIAQGASTPTASFMAIAAKVAAVAVLIRLLNSWVSVVAFSWGTVLWGMAALTLCVGPLQALAQNNMKRLLSFGAVSHVGFLLMGLAAAATATAQLERAFAGLLFYLVALAVMLLGLFTILFVLERQGEGGGEIQDYAGLGRRHPWLAASLSLLLLSFAGFPATIGFAAKFYLLAASLEGGLVGLVVIGIVASLVQATCCLEVIVTMYFKKRTVEKLRPIPYPWLVVLVLCVVTTLYWGLFPSHLLLMVGESVRSLVF